MEDFSLYLGMPGGGKDAAGCREKPVFSVKSISQESRRIVAVASREMVDRDGEIVSIAALRKAIRAYLKNPVILAGHSHRLQDGRSPVVGKVVDHRFQGKDLWITVEFADTTLGLEYWKLYRDKFQRAFSIGFKGLQAKEDYLDGKRVRVFTEIELYEISCVAVPANPAALSKGKMPFAQRKAAEREKQRILDDVDALCGLFDRFDAALYSGKLLAGGTALDYSQLDGFSAAEIEILKDFNGPGWGFDPDDADSPCADFDGDGGDGSEKSFAAILGDPEAYGQYFE